MKRGEYVFQCTKNGLLAVKGQDTKQVLLSTKCHKDNVLTVGKTMKDGSKIDIPYPEMVATYREILGGVDIADQMMGLYQLYRKSNKWWKKVFYRFLMMSIVNASIKRRSIPFT